jgi:hypothetical protein
MRISPNRKLLTPRPLVEDEAERVAALDKLAIVEQNIPAKFRRDG